MKIKRRQYNDQMLQRGYEAMGKINLCFAESGCANAIEDFSSYETRLSQQLMNKESEWRDD